MKKAISKWLLLLLLVGLHPFYNIAQSTTSKATGKDILITITGIEYDDPGFTALREHVKKNSKAKNIKQSYNSGTAKMSLTYSSSATDLWDELPATLKQPFKLTSIDDNAISLQLKPASAQSNTGKTTPVQTSKEGFQIDGKTLKGKIDPTITGLWQYTDAAGKATFMKLHADGTSESYTGPAATAVKSKGYWRVDGAFIEVTWKGYAKVERYDLQKSYDATTGKPTLAVGWATYVTADNKTSW